MKDTWLAALPLLILITALAGCTSSSGAPAGEESRAKTRICVPIRQINSYSALDDRHVLVDAAGKRTYLLTVDAACSGLRFANGIAIADQSTQICNDGFGFLSFRHAGLGKRRCRILDLRQFDDNAAARAFAESEKST